MSVKNRLRAAMGCGLLYAFFAAFMTTIPVYTHNTVNVGLLKQINGIDVSFFQWMIPGVIIGAGYTSGLIYGNPADESDRRG